MDYANSDSLTAAMGLNQKIYLDSLLSQGFFMNSFIGTFGFVAFFLEKIGIHFACFLFLKFLLEIIVTIIKALEINKLTNRTMSFWKIILGATYNLFVLSVFTSIFSNENSNLESSDLQNSRQKQIRQQNHNQNIYQESTASLPMVERNEPAVPLMSPDLRNEPGLYPDPIRYNCGMWAHSSIVHNMNMITYEIIIPPEDCKKAAKNNKITVNEDGYTNELIIKMDESILQHRNEGTSLEGDSSTACKNRGQIKHYSYKTHMQNHNQNIYQESTASLPMVERNEPAVPLMSPDLRNEPGLYPDLNNQNEQLVRTNVIGTISSTTIPHPTTNNNTITPI